MVIKIVEYTGGTNVPEREENGKLVGIAIDTVLFFCFLSFF